MAGPNPRSDAPELEFEEITLDDLDLGWEDVPESAAHAIENARPTLLDADPLRHDRVIDEHRGDDGSPPSEEGRPTLLDLDPLRHDKPQRRETGRPRESMPTLPEIDPLRYDRDE